MRGVRGAYRDDFRASRAYAKRKAAERDQAKALNTPAAHAKTAEFMARWKLANVLCNRLGGLPSARTAEWNRLDRECRH